MITTLEKLRAHWSEGRFVCLGLDPVLESMPASIRQDNDLASILAFNRSIVEGTQDIVAAYKPNVAFFERHGSLASRDCRNA